MDTYLFVNDFGYSSIVQDKIRGTFLDTPKKNEMPKKVLSTKENKSKPWKQSEPKSEVNDESKMVKQHQEISEHCETNLQVMKKMNLLLNANDEKEIGDKEKETVECEQVEHHDKTEKSKITETVSDVKPEVKEESKGSVPNIVMDETIPKTWKMKIHDDGRKVLVSPSGDFFPTRRLALKQMLESKESSKEELEEMRGCLVHEGWMTSSKLPAGWMMKVVKGKEIILLSEGMKQFGMKAAIASMEKSGRFSKDIIGGLKEMQKRHQEEEDETKQIKAEEAVKEKTDNSDLKVIKKDKEKVEEEVNDDKEEEVKEKEIKEEEEDTKEENVGEERKLEEKKEVICNLPSGWMFNLGGKVAKFTFVHSSFLILTKAMELIV